MKKKSSLPLVVGRKPLLEAFNAGKTVEKIFLLRTATGEDISQIKQLAKQHNIPLSLVPIEKLNRLTRIQHQGVVAWTSLIDYVDLQDGI